LAVSYKRKMKKIRIKDITLTAMFIALGIVLPFLTGQIPKIGSMMLPMHLPIMLCGLILGWKYGLIAGIVTPILRSFIFGMPPLFPSAVAMAFELAAYGAVIGLIFNKIKWRCIYTILFSLSVAMIAGRIVWGAVSYLLFNITAKSFTFTMFLSSAIINAIPGIILQFILIPSIMLLLKRSHIIQLTPKKHKTLSSIKEEVSEG